MFKIKNINLNNLRFIGAALLATTTTHCLNPSPVQARTGADYDYDRRLKLEKITVSHQDLTIIDDFTQSVSPLSNLKIAESNLFLAQEINSSDVNENAAGSRKTRLIKLITLAFFLLFFVPLGIFYPSFLFYKMLLIKPEDSDSTFPQDEPKESTNLTKPNPPIKKDTSKATVSKLQIAFTPPARELRKELSRVSLVTDVNPKYELVNLMHQTAKVLIEQEHWTHVSYSSETLPVDRVRPKFDAISERERQKFISKQSGLTKHNRNVSSSEGYERNYSYVVVTLILCTAHVTPLFKTINTKEQLRKELVQLSKMQEDSLIKFELLWNPQQENTYINNDRLLIEYEEMLRLL